MAIDLEKLDRMGVLHLLNLEDVSYIEIDIDAKGKVWINVDGICILRANSFGEVVVDMCGEHKYRVRTPVLK